jgi:hypothetical protein
MHVQYGDGEGRKRKQAASASASASARPAREPRCDNARLASGRPLGWERAAGEMPDSNRLCIRGLLMVASIGLPFSAWNPGTMPRCSTDISLHSRLNWKCTDTDCFAPRLSWLPVTARDGYWASAASAHGCSAVSLWGCGLRIS